MKSFKKMIASGAVAVAVVFASVLSFNAVTSAACVQYTPGGTGTTSTPVFNQFCGVPGSVGTESDFVRVRPNTGDNTTPGNNAAYVDSLDATCTTGAQFDVRTYVHNGADPTYNQNGAGPAVAHNVALAMAAPLGSTSKTFNFASTISSSNTTGMSDTATVNCGSKMVKLSLVPSTVHVYSQTYGWQGLGDSAVNGTTPLGSRVAGSGDVWACWDDRVIVVYTVQVEDIPAVQTSGTCDLFTMVATERRRVNVNQFKYTASNLTVKNVVLDWGDGSSKVTLTDTNAVVGQKHEYAKDGTYTANVVVTFSNNTTSGGAGTACAQSVTFTSGTPVTPPVTPASTVKPTSLVNTGAGSTIGMFAAATLFGTAAYRWYIGRRLGAQ